MNRYNPISKSLNKESSFDHDKLLFELFKIAAQDDIIFLYSKSNKPLYKNELERMTNEEARFQLYSYKKNIKQKNYLKRKEFIEKIQQEIKDSRISDQAKEIVEQLNKLNIF